MKKLLSLILFLVAIVTGAQGAASTTSDDKYASGTIDFSTIGSLSATTTYWHNGVKFYSGNSAEVSASNSAWSTKVTIPSYVSDVTFGKDANKGKWGSNGSGKLYTGSGFVCSQHTIAIHVNSACTITVIVDKNLAEDTNNAGITASIDGVAYGTAYTSSNYKTAGSTALTVTSSRSDATNYPGRYTLTIEVTEDNLTDGEAVVKMFNGNSGTGAGKLFCWESITVESATPSSKTATTTAITSASKEALNVDLKNGTNAGTLAATVVSGDPATDVEGASVSWESTNTSVATIDASTGAVTLVATGTTTLKATYAGNDDYATSNDSYEITVTDTRTALTASWDNTAPTFSIDEAATNPAFTVTGGEAVLGDDYTVAYAHVSGDELATIGSTGITAINTANAGTETVKATVTVTNGNYKISTTEYNCVITVANSYSVTYNANGGSGDAPTDAAIYATGATVKVADNIGTLTKAGYSVVGWNTDSEATTASQAFGSNLTMGDADVTLYAIWQKNDYTFTPKVVTENENVAKDAIVGNSVGGVMKNTQTDNTEGRIVNTAYGMMFAGSSNSKVTVTLNYDLQVGSIITATFWNNDTKSDRGVDILNADGQDKGDWYFTGDSKEHRFAYVVTSSDGFAGKNSFSLKRKGNAYLKSLTVTNCNKETYYVTVGESGFATIGMPFATTLPTGVTGYAVESVTDSKVKMSAAIEAATTIPANTGLVIVAAPETYKFTQAGAGSWTGTNILEATGEETKAATSEAPIYVFAITDATNKKVGFKKATSGSLGAYKAYLPGNVSTLTSLSASFDDATAINGVAEDDANAEAPVKVVTANGIKIGKVNVAGQQVK